MQVWILNNSGKLVAHDNLFLSIKTDGRNFVDSCSKMFYTVQHLFLWLAVILVHLLQFSWMNGWMDGWLGFNGILSTQVAAISTERMQLQ